MSDIKYVNSLGFKIFSDSLNKISIKNSPAKVINTISPNSYGIATKDKVFCESLKKSDYLVLDGVYFALASILLKGKNIRKNQGPEVFRHFINLAEQNKYRVFFLGSSYEILKKIELRIAVEYPNVKVMYYSPPFKAEFNDEDDNKMVDAINEFNPDIVFVGMTCPKQEKWSVKNRGALNGGLVVSIGNVFDWFARTQKAIHPIWYQLRIAWLVRIFLRPEILKRNIANQMRFFIDVLLILLRLKKVKEY